MSLHPAAAGLCCCARTLKLFSAQSKRPCSQIPWLQEFPAMLHLGAGEPQKGGLASARRGGCAGFEVIMLVFASVAHPASYTLYVLQGHAERHRSSFELFAFDSP